MAIEARQCVVIALAATGAMASAAVAGPARAWEAPAPQLDRIYDVPDVSSVELTRRALSCMPKASDEQTRVEVGYFDMGNGIANAHIATAPWQSEINFEAHYGRFRLSYLTPRVSEPVGYLMGSHHPRPARGRPAAPVADETQIQETTDRISNRIAECVRTEELPWY